MKSRVPVVVSVVLLFASGWSTAQERMAPAPDSAYAGDLKGRVVTLAGIEAAYAEVTIYRENTPVSQTVADANGRYAVRVPAGQCRAVFSFPGYQRATSGTVIVQDSKTTVLNAILKRPPVAAPVPENGKQPRK